MMKDKIIRICHYCNKEFITSNKQQIYCTNKCGMAKGYLAYKERKKNKQSKSEFFRIEDFGDNIIV